MHGIEGEANISVLQTSGCGIVDEIPSLYGWKTTDKVLHGSFGVHMQLQTYSVNALNVEFCEGDAPSTARRR